MIDLPRKVPSPGAVLAGCWTPCGNGLFSGGDGGRAPATGETTAVLPLKPVWFAPVLPAVLPVMPVWLPPVVLSGKKKTPVPPRITVLPPRKPGVHAKPIRGLKLCTGVV